MSDDYTPSLLPPPVPSIHREMLDRATRNFDIALMAAPDTSGLMLAITPMMQDGRPVAALVAVPSRQFLDRIEAETGVPEQEGVVVLAIFVTEEDQIASLSHVEPGPYGTEIVELEHVGAGMPEITTHDYTGVDVALDDAIGRILGGLDE